MNTHNQPLDKYTKRAIIFATLSTLLNVAFAVYYGVFGIKYNSFWYGSLAGYYVILCVIRSATLTSAFVATKKCADEKLLQKTKLYIYFGTGIALTVLEIALSVFVAQLIRLGTPVVKNSYIAIASAAYAFYKIVSSIVNVAKARKSRDLVVQTMKNINLSDAMVSILVLQTTLLTTFMSTDNVLFIRKMNTVIGSVICVTTLILSAYMVIKSIKLKKEFDKSSSI